MEDSTKLQLIRQEGEETSSLGGVNTKSESKYGCPRPIRRWTAGNIVSLLIDVAAIGLSGLFLVYGFAVRAHEGLPLDSSVVITLQKGAHLGPTIYPILFAAVVGKALKSMAFWKLEKGGRIGLLDQVLGSMTITQTVMTQIQLRAPNVIGALLILLWALSPLGGQASLRIVSTESLQTNTSTTVSYVNTSSLILSLEYAGADTKSQFVPVDALFGAAMIPVGTARPASLDPWNNLKVPWIEYLDPSTMDMDGWYPAPATDSSDDYTAVVGLPLSAIPQDVTTTFRLQTSYWILDCPLFVKYEASPHNWTVPTSNKVSSSNLELSSLTSRTNAQTEGSFADMLPRNIGYYKDTGDHGVEANCTIRSSYVEIAVMCSAGTCKVVRIRKTQQASPPDSWTPMDTMSFSGFYWFAAAFIAALPVSHDDAQSPYQNFIIDPRNAFTNTYIGSIYPVGNKTFALRLSQLMNTYWIAMLAPNAVPKGLSNGNISADIAAIDGSQHLSAVATVTRSQQVLACRTEWLLVLIVSATLMAGLGVCGLVANLYRRGPDLGLNISSMVKDSPFVNRLRVGSTLDPGERARAWKDLVVKYGDVKPEDETGYIAVGTASDVHSIGTLRSRRLYE